MTGKVWIISGIVLILFLGMLLLVGPARFQKLRVSDHKKIRAFLDQNSHALYQFDPDISYMFKPNFQGTRQRTHYNQYSHQTNSLGLIGSEEIDADSRKKRVLFLGDSVLYGDRIEYQYTIVPQMMRLAQDKYQLANGSCPGWSTHQEIIFYQKYLADIDWEAIVIVFVLNDLVEFEWVYGSERKFKLSAEIENVGGMFPQHILRSFPRRWKTLELWKIRLGFYVNPKTRTLARLNNTCLFSWSRASWEKYQKEVLQQFFSDSQKSSRVVLVAVPARPQIEAYHRGAAQDVVWYPQDHLRSLCREHGVSFIDLKAFFVRDGIELDEMYYDDLHLSEKGQRLCAGYLWGQLLNILEG